MFDEKLKSKAEKIKVLAMDVDGTLTDAKVYYSKNGEELKSFSIRDGMGIELLHINGIIPAIITTETTPIVLARAQKLRIEQVILGARNKAAAVNELAARLGISVSEIAFIGDDINDILAFEICGLTACPANSATSVLDKTNYICSKNGGDGAVREFIELILLAQNKSIFLESTW